MKKKPHISAAHHSNAGCRPVRVRLQSPSSEAAGSTSAGEVQTEAPAPEVQEDNTPAEEAAASEALSAAEAEPTGYEPKYHFPGSDTAKLHYSNDYALPISEDGATLTWMRTQLNLNGAPLGERGTVHPSGIWTPSSIFRRSPALPLTNTEDQISGLHRKK